MEAKANIEADNMEQLKTSVKTLEEKLAVFLSKAAPEEGSSEPVGDDGIVDSEIKDV